MELPDHKPEMTTVAEPAPTEEAKPGFWQRRIVRPIRTQLTQGVSPERLTWAVIVGGVTGVFPILGTTQILATLMGVIFRLNQAVLQSINLICYPLHLLLILPLIRIGEYVYGAEEPISFHIPTMLGQFFDSPAAFFTQFGMTCIHCISAWFLLAPIATGVLYITVLPVMRRLRARKS